MIDKERALERNLASLRSVDVAYSVGVNRSNLACIAHRALPDSAWAITVDSPSYPQRHRAIAIEVARQFGLHHEIIDTSELQNPDYRANPANRCYFCKHELYTHLTRIAADRGAVVVDGNNADDRGDYRPRCCRSEEHTSELQSRFDLVCRLLLEKKKKKHTNKKKINNVTE